MVRHADAIAEHGATGEWAGRIDREYRNFFSERSILRDQPIDERRFSSARRPGDSDHLRMTGLGVDSLDDRARLRRAILDHRDQLSQRAPLARVETLEESVQPRVPGPIGRCRMML